MSRQRTLKAMLACACLISAGPARADVVVDWNVFAAQAIGAAARPGPTSVFDFAMVHAAVHDAVQAIEGRFSHIAQRSQTPRVRRSPLAPQLLMKCS